MPNEIPSFDLQRALENVGGDDDVLQSVAEAFAVECPEQVTAIREAGAAGDAEQLARAAHKLKGSVGLFAADRATSVVLTLEAMGRDGDLAGFDDAFAELQCELDRLTPSIAQLLQ